MSITFWILLAVSSGHNNAGTTTVVEKFLTEEQCEATRARMPVGPLKTFCVKASGGTQ